MDSREFAGRKKKWGQGVGWDPSAVRHQGIQLGMISRQSGPALLEMMEACDSSVYFCCVHGAWADGSRFAIRGERSCTRGGAATGRRGLGVAAGVKGLVHGASMVRGVGSGRRCMA